MTIKGDITRELAKAARVTEEQASAVLQHLGFPTERHSELAFQAFRDAKLGDLRISAKLGGLIVAR